MAFHTTAIAETRTEVTLVAVSVKNTFIDGFYEEELAQAAVPVRRNCSSLPPRFRCTAPAPFLKGTSNAVEKSNFGDEDASTEVATSEGEDASSRSEVGASEIDDVSMEAETSSSEDNNTMHQPPPIPVQRSALPKTSLNSRAKAWNPGEVSQSWPASATTTCTNPLYNSTNFGLQLTTVIAATRMALLGCTHVLTVEAAEARAACNIVVHLSQKDARWKEAVLTIAKQALLNAAEVSQHVYVFGYKHRPFVNTHEGFIATLGCVPHENLACWGLIQQGFCKFGPRCQWQHPEAQTTVTVTVVLDDVQQ